uniref:Uncharacterized protein n=1 Tax=Anguilla anguilla TaxID=7936 RepID=A0A0E9PP73_ANGAN
MIICAINDFIILHLYSYSHRWLHLEGPFCVGVCIFSLCPHGYPLGTPVSSHSLKTCKSS